MFIELAEYLRCPEPHEDTYLVLATGAMKGRCIAFGTVGCPVCRAEYIIANGVARFGTSPERPAPPAPLPPPDAVHALLGLTTPGGYVVLLGSAGDMGERLGQVMPGVHFVAVNLVGAGGTSTVRSLMTSERTIPLKTVARGVVVGAEYADAPWLAEAARVLLRGQRLVALTEAIAPPPDVMPVAAGQGMWVGRKAS